VPMRPSPRRAPVRVDLGSLCNESTCLSIHDSRGVLAIQAPPHPVRYGREESLEVHNLRSGGKYHAGIRSFIPKRRGARPDRACRR